MFSAFEIVAHRLFGSGDLGQVSDTLSRMFAPGIPGSFITEYVFNHRREILAHR